MMLRRKSLLTTGAVIGLVAGSVAGEYGEVRRRRDGLS